MELYLGNDFTNHHWFDAGQADIDDIFDHHGWKVDRLFPVDDNWQPHHTMHENLDNLESGPSIDGSTSRGHPLIIGSHHGNRDYQNKISR